MRRAFVCDMAPVQQETIPYAEQIRREQEARAAGDAGEGGGEPPGVHSRLLGRFALDGRYAYGLRAADDGAVHVFLNHVMAVTGARYFAAIATRGTVAVTQKE